MDIEMNLKLFLKLARMYSNLGDVICDQLDQAVENDTFEDMSRGAMEYVKPLLRELSFTNVYPSGGVYEKLIAELKNRQEGD